MYLVSWHGMLVSYHTALKSLVQVKIDKYLEQGSLVSVAMPNARDEEQDNGLINATFDQNEIIMTPPFSRVRLKKQAGQRRVHLIESNLFLAAEPSGHLTFDRVIAGVWETFYLISPSELRGILATVSNDWNLERSLPIPHSEIEIRPGFVLAFGKFQMTLDFFLSDTLPRQLKAADFRSPVVPFGPIPHVLDSYAVTLASALRLFHKGHCSAALKVLEEMARDHGDLDEIVVYARTIADRLQGITRSTIGICDRAGITWERDWLNYLLPDMPFLAADDCVKEHRNETIIVLDNHMRSSSAEFYRQAFQMGRRIILFHLSDEHYDDDYDAYHWCSHVFRNYYSPLMTRKSNLSFFALGYKSGFEGVHTPISAQKRKYLWSFAGDPHKSNRQDMLRAMRLAGPGREHLTTGFASNDALDIVTYSRLIQEAIFIPCPTGWDNLDSFRVYETLEAGSIPIVERREGFDYFLEAFNGYPFLSVSNWNEAPALIKGIREADKVDDCIAKCFSWWNHYKHGLRQHIVATVGESY